MAITRLFNGLGKNRFVGRYLSAPATRPPLYINGGTWLREHRATWRTNNRRPVLRDLRRLFGEGTYTGLGDEELLARFVAERDEVAFEALLAAHGPMVLTVCRRVLSNPSDVEDAFQATFLVLARKANSVRADGSLGSWLHRVANRVAVEANRDAIRRRTREVTAAVLSSADRDGDRTPEVYRPALHEELARLPEKFRRPVVLCYLEGRTQEEVAGELH